MCEGKRGIKVKGSTETIVPTKLICLGRNYRRHAEELGNAVPEKPIIFLKPPSSLIVEGDKIILPPQSQDVHHEVELGVVIGKTGRCISRPESAGYILGYCIFLDITARDIQREETKRGAPWALAKGFDTFAPVSQIVRNEDISHPEDLAIRLWVNDELRQDSNTRFMIFRIGEIIEYISSYMTLEAGDIIATGTPEGVGPIRKGDVVTAEISGIGRIRFEAE
ncbi:MAG: fumarylacetoacetate hydrolase family protein [Nitrospirae bacterium]|nr:fumarylacetoacetate hydrolase family protein [Nitrospirota bacterium]